VRDAAGDGLDRPVGEGRAPDLDSGPMRSSMPLEAVAHHGAAAHARHDPGADDGELEGGERGVPGQRA
jgi:hypothetical protein